MKNYQTVWWIKQTVAMMVDEIVTSNMFNDSFWIEIINEAMSYVYGYHKWNWNISNETKTIANNKITLDYTVQEIVKVTVWATVYTQAQYYIKDWKQQFILQWDTIILPDWTTGDANIIYRRWFKPYTVNNINTILDIPFYLNNVIVSLMQFKLLPIWLWEGSWWLMNNYLQDALQQLERYKAMNTYAEATKYLNPNRR